jgi:hydrogenase maturation protease
MKTLIIGLGNPILGDDGVGWKVAQEVQRTIEMDTCYHMPIRPLGTKTVLHTSQFDVECASLGGLSLMERMVGYQRAILVDSMETGKYPMGSVMVFPLEALTNPMDGHSASAHDTSLITALKTARTMGLSVPESVEIVAIEAKNVYDFSDELSPAVAKAVPLAAEAVINLLKMEEP